MISIRPAISDDINDVIGVCDLAWDGIWHGSRHMFIDRILTFPECGIVVGEIDGHIEGYVSVQLTNESIPCGTWNEATDFGHIKHTHNPEGSWLHGVGLALTPKGSKNGLTIELIRYLGEYVVKNNKLGAMFVTRMPGYYRYRETMTPGDYALYRKNGKLIDPELRVLERCGFRPVHPPIIMEGYVENGGDPRSCNYSVLVKRLSPIKGGPPL